MRSLIENGPDRHDLDCIAHALAAGARGDAEASLESELAGRVIVQSPHRFILQDLIEQGDGAPAWAYSRWCADLAARSMLLEGDSRMDMAVQCVLATLYPDSVARVLDGEVDLRVLGTSVAAGDRLVGGVALYELGGLADYIDERAEAGLLDRADRVRDWADAQIGAYEFLDFRGCRLVLRDLVDGCEVEALNIGAMADASDCALVGRLVPIASEPGRMFADRPIHVDLATARAVAEAVRTQKPLAWLDALADALTDGRHTEGFHRTPFTLFTSDLPMPQIGIDGGQQPEREAQRITDLRAKGYSADVANAIGVLEVGLMAARFDDRSAAAVSADVVAALGTPGAFEAAAVECTDRDKAKGWRTLAAVVPDHAAERCRTLAHHAECARQGS